jgi:DNA-binding beta-propeller fold protein YncE
MSTIFSETNAEGENRAEQSYAVKGPSGITSYGNDDPGDDLTRQFTPFQAVHFPLTIGSATLLEERTRLDWGTDEDGDGRNETFNLRLFQFVDPMESVTVPAGTFPNALKITQGAGFLVTFTTGGTVILVQLSTAWHVPGVGMVKQDVKVQIEGEPMVTVLTEELLAYVVNGQGSGLRIELMSGTSSITSTLQGTKQLQAVAYDKQNRPVVGLPFSWFSADPLIATVDQNGLMTGVASGSTTVMASIGGLVSNSLPIVVMDIRLVAMYTRDIAYDPVGNRIYASVAGNSGNISNTLAAINPDTGTVESSISVGADPGKLSISDGGQYLYVAVDSGKSVTKIHIPTRTIQQSFSLGTYAVQDMEVLTGTSQSLVIARRVIATGAAGGVAVYDNGVPRAVTTPGLGQTLDPIPILLEKSSSSSIVYGVGGDSLFDISIASSGAMISSIRPTGIDGRDMVQDSGLLYFPAGEVYSQATSALLGTYQVPIISNVLNKVLPYASLNRVFFAQFFSSYLWLAFDQTTFAPAGSVNIFDIGTGTPLRFIRWGSNGLALSTDAGQLFIFKSTLFQ